MISSGFKLEICTIEATSLQTGVANAHGPSPWGKGPWSLVTPVEAIKVEVGGIKTTFKTTKQVNNRYFVRTVNKWFINWDKIKIS